MNDTEKRIAELEKELAELKKKRNSERNDNYIFNEKNTDIIMYEDCRGEKYFKDFKKLFEAIKKKMKNTYKFSIWYRKYDDDYTQEFDKQWNIDDFNENEILEIISSLNAQELLFSEICISNKKDEIVYQIYFNTPFLKKYDEIVIQRLTNDEKEYWNIVDEGKKWRLFK